MRILGKGILLAVMAVALLGIGFFLRSLAIETENSREAGGSDVVSGGPDILEIHKLGEGYLVALQEGSDTAFYRADQFNPDTLGQKIYETPSSLVGIETYSSYRGEDRAAVSTAGAGDNQDVFIVDSQNGVILDSVEEAIGEAMQKEDGEFPATLVSFERWASDGNEFWVYASRFVDKEPQYLVRFSLTDGAVKEVVRVHRGFPYQPYSE